MSEFNISIPCGESKRLLTGGKYCHADIVVSGTLTPPKSLVTVESFDDTSVGVYRYIKIKEPDEAVKITLTEKDPTIDISGIYFGSSATGSDPSGGVVWMIDNGMPQEACFPMMYRTNENYLSIYPTSREAWDKLFSRYDVFVIKPETSIDDLIEGFFSGSYTNDRIYRINQGGLSHSSKLTEVNFPNVIDILPYAFEMCTGLRFVNLPSAQKVYSGVFYGCTALEKLDLPRCRFIGTAAFLDCTLLGRLVLRHGEIVTLENTNAFTGTPIAGGTGYVYVPDNLVDSYKTATNWSAYASQIKPISELEE